MSSALAPGIVAVAVGAAASAALIWRASQNFEKQGRQRRRRIRCITFDLDDTIWACEPVISRASAAFMQFLEHELPLVFAQFPTIERWRAHSRSVCAPGGACTKPYDLSEVRRVALREAARLAGMNAVDTERAVELGFNEFMSIRNKVDDFVFDGAVRLLRRIRASGVQLGALSNGNADVSKIKSLKGLFDFAVSPASAGAKKPDMAPFRLALQLSICDHAHEMIHVGDSLCSDVWPAQEFGVDKAVWVKTGSVWSGTHPSCSKASDGGDSECRGEGDVQVESLTELEALLVKWRVIE